MIEQLDVNESLLSIYFNIMILCKQFNSNKILYLINNADNISILNKNCNSIADELKNHRNDSSQDILTTPTRKLYLLKTNFKLEPNESSLKTVKIDYDADSELSIAGLLKKQKKFNIFKKFIYIF